MSIGFLWSLLQHFLCCSGGLCEMLNSLLHLAPRRTSRSNSPKTNEFCVLSITDDFISTPFHVFFDDLLQHIQSVPMNTRVNAVVVPNNTRAHHKVTMTSKNFTYPSCGFRMTSGIWMFLDRMLTETLTGSTERLGTWSSRYLRTATDLET